MCNSNPLKPAPYKITDIIRDTEHEWTFRIAYDGPAAPGQFFMVSIPRVGEMPISVSGLLDGALDMTIRKVGKVTSEVFTLTEGATIFMRGPYGTSFNYDDYRGKNLVVVGGGSGTAPVRPIVEYFYTHPDEIKSLDVIFGFRDPSFILFKEDTERWAEKFNMILTIDRPAEGWTGKTGLTTQYIAELDIDDVENTHAVIVGPPVMIGFCAKEFIKKGLTNSQITVSLERRMACGIGKCGRCKIGDIYICQDGPIMSYEKAVKLID